ncbi:MAG TPA: hypothetical protein PK385_00090 [Spirochaetota bacterium]|nr:hypothetical protein [Spirochaetota bacterium]HOS32339.1 hypothetical protein [Spirochaetota bacterium]HOS54436.1 hypothetical protein [Spirochaetota bacterium]HQF76929.1 hypothetical protein [Spirochaetota bacterium]HQH30156.1 hypothetical protein [Spirochaetota bacterium]
MKLFFLAFFSPIYIIWKIIYSIFSNLRKIDFWDLLLLFFTFFAGYFFIFSNLGDYGFQTDEYYHAQIVDSYIKGYGLFKVKYLNNIIEHYTRSQITSLLAIVSKLFFDFFRIELSNEFILRFPIGVVGVLNIIMIYKISNFLMGKFYSLCAALVFGSEIWIIYFAKYLRFYTIGIFFILFVFFLLFRYNFDKKSILFSLFISIIGMLFVELYLFLLFIIVLILFFIKFSEIIKTFYNSKKFLFLFFVALLLIIFLFIIGPKIGKILMNPRLVGWSFNKKYFEIMLNWILFNYPLLFVSFVLIFLICMFSNGIFTNNIRLFVLFNPKNLLVLFICANILFLFGYIINVPFNITFRPISFFLPIMFIIYIYALYYLSIPKIVFVSLVALNIIFNIISINKYNIKSPGDYYYPTKLIYEKKDIVLGDKDVAKYLKNYISDNRIEKYKIHYVGAGAGFIAYYLNDYENIYSYANTSNGVARYKDLENNIKINLNKTNFIVINPTAYANRVNHIYKEFFNRTYVVECSTEISEQVHKKSEYKYLHTSDDKFTNIFIYNNL